MAARPRDVEGNWYGVMVHSPSRGVVHVSFVRRNGSFIGEWDFPGLSGGAGRRGAFTATRFANFLNIRIRTKPLANVQCQLTIIKDKGKSMITGVIPLEGEAIPFLTITLFRGKPAETDMDGICPILQYVPKGDSE
jgi:hypothetical protein